MANLYRQAELISGNQHLICWLPVERLKEGTTITLRGDETQTVWHVVKVYGLPVTKESLYKPWNNNI